MSTEFAGLEDDMSQYREACHKMLNDLVPVALNPLCVNVSRQEEYFKQLEDDIVSSIRGL